MQSNRPFELDELQCINTSSGIDIAPPYADHGNDLPQPYTYADQAMYRTKERGRNQTNVFRAPESGPTFVESRHTSA